MKGQQLSRLVAVVVIFYELTQFNIFVIMFVQNYTNKNG